MARLTPGDVCVLVPAYNEARHLHEVGSGILNLGYPLLVVDDGSTDGTQDEAKKLSVPVLRFTENRGKGAALRKGFEWVLERPYQALIVVDADGQHDPAELEIFIEALNNGADVVLGNRMCAPSGMPFIRRATNRTMSRVLSWIAGQDIPDSQCGYKAMKREVVEKIWLRTDRFQIESEMLLEAARRGFTIRSVPIRCLYGEETSRIRPLRDTARFFAFLFQYLLSRKKHL